MNCPFCEDDLSERVFFEDCGWFAFLDANPMLSGHTILARKTSGPCPDTITKDSLAAVDLVLPTIVEALKEAYGARDVLVTSLRGTVRHTHFHLIPLTESAEHAWREECLWETGHLHECLGHYEKGAFLANERERIENGWTENDQRAVHSKKLRPEVEKLRAVITCGTA